MQRARGKRLLQVHLRSQRGQTHADAGGATAMALCPDRLRIISARCGDSGGILECSRVWLRGKPESVSARS